MILYRFLSALVAIPLISVIIYRGGGIYVGVVFFLVLLGALEFANISKKMAPQFPVTLFAILVAITLAGGVGLDLFPDHLFFLSVLLVMMARVLYIADYGSRHDGLRETLLMLVGIILLGWLGQYLLRLRWLDGNGAAVFAVFAFVWSADTGAYFVGRRFGQRFFSPYVSPQKSLEGYLGGIVASLIVGLLFVRFFFPEFPLPLAFALGLILPILSPIGDFTMSLLKREADVKDAGYLVPGHGGLLDRFDTILLGCAVGYYIIVIFEKI